MMCTRAPCTTRNYLPSERDLFGEAPLQMELEGIRRCFATATEEGLPEKLGFTEGDVIHFLKVARVNFFDHYGGAPSPRTPLPPFPPSPIHMPNGLAFCQQSRTNPSSYFTVY